MLKLNTLAFAGGSVVKILMLKINAYYNIHMFFTCIKIVAPLA
jgi:hypothetical protein